MKLKRGLEDVTEAKRSAEANPQPCGMPGETCKRSPGPVQEMKRSAEALAEAIAEASPEAFGDWCYMPGQTCMKFRRGLENTASVKRSANALADALAVGH